MMDGKGGDAESGDRSQPGSAPGRSWRSAYDLMAGVAVVGLACLAAVAFPEGSALRMALAVPVLFWAPGHLLIEAAVGPAGRPTSRALRPLVAFGASPAIVGLVALATAGLPGGFRPASILLLVAVASLALAGAALWRRVAHVRQAAAQPTLA